MKAIQIEMDGIKYFVKAENFACWSDLNFSMTGDGMDNKVKLTLYLKSLRTKPIYSDLLSNKYWADKVNKSDAKKFILRALAVK